MASARQDRIDHVLFGVSVRIVKGAKPAGWPEDEPFDDYPQRHYSEVTDVSPAEDGFPYGTVEAGGWWWSPSDLVVY